MTPSLTPAGFTLEERTAVLEEMNRILNSSQFHSSARCQEFLRYIVERTLDGSTELLKERNIGVDVFHRSPAYEPNTDAIVRVRATEVRKRLVQYYDHAPPTSAIRILLAAGSYVPEFRWHARDSSSPPAAARRSVRAWWLASTLAALIIAAAAYGVFRTPASPLRAFWQPTLNSPNQVVICLGQPVVYHLSRRVHENYRRTLPPDRPPGPYVIPLKPGDIEVSDVLPVPDQYVGAGSARAAARLSALLANWRKPSQIRIGNDFSFYDLRNYPAVLVGAFSNEWSLKLARRMPFVFVQEHGVRGIRETAAPHRQWLLPALQGDGNTTEDYAVAARVFDSGTLEPLILVAGITQYGTQAAGEFIATEESVAAAIAAAPTAWRTRNLAILLHLNIIGKAPGKPEILAVRTW